MIGDAMLADDAADAAPGSARPLGAVSPPVISLPRGGGAIRGIGETFSVDPASGTSSMSVPIATSPGRSEFHPELSLAYDSGTGNGSFGFGWKLAVPSVSRRTDRGLPRYRDAGESDTFVLSGTEDLVPFLSRVGADWVGAVRRQTAFGAQWVVHRYRPRTEGQFARIEHWRAPDGTQSHWRVTTRENVTSVYGQTAGARIADPADASRIFEWLLERTYDDKGDLVVYEYKTEDGAGIDTALPHERHRGPPFAQRYLKRIKYGNRAPHTPGSTPFEILFSDGPSDWLFEVVFDYGEHDPLVPHPSDDPRVSNSGPWPVRLDVFSSGRPGFDLRTYRLCRRVLMFHHLPGGARGERGYDGLVRSTDFGYRESATASFLASVTQTGYVRQPGDTYLTRALPPLVFGYSEAVIDERVHEVAPESVQNLPRGVDGVDYRWLDLDGEGLDGILTEQAGGWWYHRNRLAARFGPAELVTSKPARALADGRAQFFDLAGDGQVDLVDLDGPVPGFYERTDDGGWQAFRPFGSRPNLDTADPNLRLVDLDGDGRADVLVTEEEALRWYASLGEDGFGPAETVAWSPDEEDGPRIALADPTGSIFLADMSGDGLADLVRIRDGAVCYWPNLGYGRFGPKVTMDNPPRFDHTGQFDPARIRLGDIDGSGTTDLFYLHRDGIRLWHNRSGNGWSPERRLTSVPATSDITTVSIVDLLGNGTACLVWSSPLPADAARPLRYVDLMGGRKPHLLTRVVNNLGAETRVTYTSSTTFSVADRAAGRPWITRLPFPVHVVERVETFDWVSRNRFVTRYAYHHGHFDGVEREFGGFGMIERWDTEEFDALAPGTAFPAATNLDAASDVAPTRTRTWQHTGAYLRGTRVSRHLAREYYREPGLTDDEFVAQLLPDTTLPPGLSPDEERQACRALRGSVLHQEVHGEDPSPAAEHPYNLTERDYTVELVQPMAGNRHAVFLVHPRETIDRHYERDPVDPRVSHQLTLRTDEFGNVLTSATVGYGRRHPDPDLSPEDQGTQAETLITCAENLFTNAVDIAAAYRTPLPAEMLTYQLTGLAPGPGQDRLGFDELRTAIAAATNVAYEQAAPAGVIRKRLIEHVRIRYRPDDLGAAANDPLALLPDGELQPLGLPGETYAMAFSPGLLAGVYQRQRPGRPPEDLLGDPAAVLAGPGAGYVDVDGSGHWWVPSGRTFYSPDPADRAAIELAHARAHFFLPHRYRNPFDAPGAGTQTVVDYDAHDLLVQQTRDPLGNRVTVGEPGGRHGHDYRVLRPRLVTDANDNRSAIAFDALGMVAATAALEGDTADDFTDVYANPTLAELQAFAADPRADAPQRLQGATSRVVYDVDRYRRCGQPAFAATLTREIHLREGGARTRIQISVGYSDGYGRELQTKIQAEPGDALQRHADAVLPSGDVQPGDLLRGADGRPVAAHTDGRWVGRGRTVYNNKGSPVKQYEPFFAATHLYEPEPEMTDTGVTPVLCYDPVGRVVTTLQPNGTYEKTGFGSWRQAAWDGNDTVLLDPGTDPDVRAVTQRYLAAEHPPPNVWQTWHAARAGGARGPHEQAAADKAAAHAGTPTLRYVDALGRVYLTVADNGDVNGVRQRYPTRVSLDIEGSQRTVTDAMQRTVLRVDYDMLGNRIHQASMDAGRRWFLGDVGGNPIRAWDSRGHDRRTEYDRLRRPVRRYVRGTDPASSDPRTLHREVLVEVVEYGEGQPDDVRRNLRTRVFRQYDSVGVVTNDLYDFKGNLRRSSRELTRDYAGIPDWSAAPAVDGDIHRSSATYDALNRPVTAQTPDASTLRHTYNDAGLLEAVDANLRGEQPGWTPFVTNIDYDEKGQRTRIVRHTTGAHNEVETRYRYDRETFRLANLTTHRAGDPAPLQDLHYTYDPVGNITHIRDDAAQTVFFRNRRVEPGCDYTYDPLYRLTQVGGREHLGQNAGGQPLPPTAPTHDDGSRIALPHPADGNAMGTYQERYDYDEVGNILELVHRGADPQHPGWRRSYQYNEPSLIGAGSNNRLTRTTLHPNSAAAVPEPYTHDAHGNMTAMPQLQDMQWDFDDRLAITRRQAVNPADLDGERTYYQYDAAGQRVRKVTTLADGRPKDERIYLGGLEVYRRHHGSTLVRDTLHVTADGQPIALVETRVRGNEPRVPARLVRHQLGDHLGSTVLELDDRADIVSYQEYYPYGATSYQAVRSRLEAPNRYRYTSKERDDENGLYYHGARYYAPWLGRWTSADPSGGDSSPNLFGYVSQNPVRLVDPNGREERSPYWQAVQQRAAVEGIIAARDLLAHLTSIVGGGASLQGIRQDQLQANLLLAGGDYKRAREVATGYAEYFELQRAAEAAGSSGGEQAALLAGHATGFNQGVEFYQAVTDSNTELTGFEIATKGVDAVLRFLFTVATIWGGVRLAGGALRPVQASPKVVNIGGPLDKVVSARSLRPDYVNVDIVPSTSKLRTVIANVNEVDLSSILGDEVRLLRASNVPFVQVPSGRFVKPDAFVKQAQGLGAKRVIVTTGESSREPIRTALSKAGFSVRQRRIRQRVVITGRR